MGLPPRPSSCHFPQQMELTGPVSGKLFPCQARACRAPGSGFPRTLLAQARSWGKLGLRKRQLSGFRSNFHPHRGGNRGGQRRDSGARDHRQRKRLRRPRAEGSKGGGGPQALTSSAIFQTFDPFRKARCFPAAAAAARPCRPGRQRARRPGAGPSHHLPRSQRPPWLLPGPLTAARAPPGPRRTLPAPLSRRRAPAPRGGYRRRSPQRPRMHSANLSRCHRVPTASVAPRLALPSRRRSRRHGGPAAAAAPAGLHA